MAKKRRQQEAQYSICDILELEVFIPMLPADLGEHFEEEKLDFGFLFDYFWNLEEETFSVVIEVSYIYDREERNELLLKYIGEVQYHILDLEKFVDARSKQINFTRGLLAILTGIAISTIRGMIAVRTFGKFQADFYIPILKPMDVVDNYIKQASSKTE